MRTVDYGEAYTLLKEVVRGFEEHVDPRAAAGEACEYEPQINYCGCIVGRMLLKLGVSRIVLRQMDDAASRIGSHVDLLRTQADLDLTPDAVRIWEMAQHMQDFKWPWAAALCAAEQVRSQIWQQREYGRG